jgi:hypothetical protein
LLKVFAEVEEVVVGDGKLGSDVGILSPFSIEFFAFLFKLVLGAVELLSESGEVMGNCGGGGGGGGGKWRCAYSVRLDCCGPATPPETEEGGNRKDADVEYAAVSGRERSFAEPPDCAGEGNRGGANEEGLSMGEGAGEGKGADAGELKAAPG